MREYSIRMSAEKKQEVLAKNRVKQKASRDKWDYSRTRMKDRLAK